jgi:hypothetical protein
MGSNSIGWRFKELAKWHEDILGSKLPYTLLTYSDEFVLADAGGFPLAKVVNERDLNVLIAIRCAKCGVQSPFGRFCIVCGLHSDVCCQCSVIGRKDTRKVPRLPRN